MFRSRLWAVSAGFDLQVCDLLRTSLVEMVPSSVEVSAPSLSFSQRLMRLLSYCSKDKMDQNHPRISLPFDINAHVGQHPEASVNVSRVFKAFQSTFATRLNLCDNLTDTKIH